MLLHDQKFLGQMLPRIPVLVMRDLESKLEPYADAGRAKQGQRDHFKYVESYERMDAFEIALSLMASLKFE